MKNTKLPKTGDNDPTMKEISFDDDFVGMVQPGDYYQIITGSRLPRDVDENNRVMEKEGEECCTGDCCVYELKQSGKNKTKRLTMSIPLENEHEAA